MTEKKTKKQLPVILRFLISVHPETEDFEAPEFLGKYYFS
jgi:hypothetical protein